MVLYLKYVMLAWALRLARLDILMSVCPARLCAWL